MEYPAYTHMLREFYGPRFLPDAPLPAQMGEDLWFYRQYLAHVLSGEGKHYGAFQQELQTLFETETFCIYTVRFYPSKIRAEGISREQYQLCHVWSNSYNAIAGERLSCKYVLMEQNLYCIVNTRHLEDPNVEGGESFVSEASDLASDLVQWMVEYYGIHTSVYFSSPYHNIRNIEKAFYETKALAEFGALAMAQDRVVCYSYLYLNKKDVTLTAWIVDAEKRYLNALFCGEYKAARNILIEILEKRLSGIQTGTRIQEYISDKLVLAMNVYGQSGAALPKPLWDDVYNLPRKDTVAQVREAIYGLFRALDEAGRQGSAKCSYSIREVIGYIQDHFHEPGLDVSCICGKFNVSYSYLSRSFKQQTGIGLLDYIQLTRLEAAKQLLTSTKYGMDKIALRVGFSGRWTLQRAFQKFEGTTPSVYRVTHMEK